MRPRLRPFLLPVLALALAPLVGRSAAPGSADPRAAIRPADVETHLWHVAGPELEGRDSPSAGLARAATYLVQRFEEIGLEPVGGELFRRPFERDLPEPVPEACALSVAGEDGEEVFVYGADFVPLAHCDGEGEGEVVFVGYGINERKERFTDVEDVRGKVAVLVEGEPRHKRKFDGPDVSKSASLWSKLGDLSSARAAGALVVRRPPEIDRPRGAPELEPIELGFRYTFATWSDERMRGARDAAPDGLPVLEITLDAARRILGEDVDALADRIDRTGKSIRLAPKGLTARLRARTARGSVAIANVVGLLRGSDPALADEYVVLGAHYDHIGVDERGRIGFGADDNGSGTAALIEVAEALGRQPPPRSVLVCAFAAEEDGLLGSRAIVDDPPVPGDRIVAMVNMDMIGRGDADEVAVLGIRQNPKLEKLLERARKLSRTGVRDIVVRKGEELFERSDHFPFHEAGIPALFFFEGVPISRNRDYHTYRDTVDKVDVDKVTNTARLVYNTVWLLAEDDARPPAPRD